MATKEEGCVIITIKIKANLHNILREEKTTKQSWFEFLCKPALLRLQEEKEAERRMYLSNEQIEDENAKNALD